MSNMRIWEQVKRPDKSVLKKIEAGRLRGFTDINPQWRFQIMTEVFGPCGGNWRYEIVDILFEPGSDGQVSCIARVEVSWREGEEWSFPVPGVGASMYIVNEKNGPRTNDEAPKMAVTDALSVAFKALGVAADVYLRLFDGSKYRDDKTQPKNDDPIPEEVALDELVTILSSFDEADAASAWAAKNSALIQKQLGGEGKYLEQFRAKFTSYVNSLKETP